MKRLALLNFVVVLCLLILACGKKVDSTTSSPSAATLTPKPEIGYLAPDFSLNSYDGKKVTLRELRGKPVFLNFWSTT